ncbi:U6 snRNA phosphodiesterase [Colletotrichum chlorophyti]|uniref:U6 snRNA phosphodiesterase n=1 Tax=Colletotrichum chlorophyti TaxID=708187 RepID=A0A1Q8REV9_9PEZI|nr:U6 snRNA phosphodiesterase [Colletotrichum chlorophyti]
MALVDYSSSDSAPEAGSPPAKRRKPSNSKTHGSEPNPDHIKAGAGAATRGKAVDPKAGDSPTEKQAVPSSALPPLPEEFHDLYASTVRTSTADNPALHQGRKRTIPHIAGNWPSHIYIEWHPTADQHSFLAALLNRIESLLGSKKLYPLLTSDLNTPLPLHVSLSRPLSLTTAQKDPFLSALKSSVSSATGEFSISPRGLGFFKSPDSDRAFLVLRVANALASSQDTTSTTGKNPQLRALLNKCNAVALRFDHPPLYQAHATDLVDDAFHVSIGWTFGLPGEDACLRTYDMLKLPEFNAIRRWEIDVTGVKAKIGNVVTHIPLNAWSKDRKKTATDGTLFG